MGNAHTDFSPSPHVIDVIIWRGLKLEGRRTHIGQITNAQTFRSEKRHHFEYIIVFMKVILTVILKKQSWRRGNSFGLVTRVGNG